LLTWRERLFVVEDIYKKSLLSHWIDKPFAAEE
jgi:hypothetical protein